MDGKLLIGLFLGILAYSFLYLAKGIEKFAIEGIKAEGSVKSKSSVIWVFGVLLNAVYMFSQWAALRYAPVNLIAPLNGIGLIVFLLFCFYVLKEKIKRKEVLGVALIMAGTVVISISNTNNSLINPDSFNLNAFLVFLIAVLCCEIAVVVISKVKRFKFTGVIVGLTAGSFFAFETVSKRITALEDHRLRILFSVLTMLISLIGFIFTQYALVKEKANIAVPCFTSTSVIFAAIIGVVFLGEGSNLWSFLGITAILAGIVLLTAFKGRAPSKEPIKSLEMNYT